MHTWTCHCPFTCIHFMIVTFISVISTVRPINLTYGIESQLGVRDIYSMHCMLETPAHACTHPCMHTCKACLVLKQSLRITHNLSIHYNFERRDLLLMESSEPFPRFSCVYMSVHAYTDILSLSINMTLHPLHTRTIAMSISAECSKANKFYLWCRISARRTCITYTPCTACLKHTCMMKSQLRYRLKHTFLANKRLPLFSVLCTMV